MVTSDSLDRRGNSGPPLLPARRSSKWVLVCLAATVLLAGGARNGQEPPQNPAPASATAPPNLETAAGAPAAVSGKPSRHAKPASLAAFPPNLPIAEQSARLLKLATDLKTEVDKSNKDILSLGVVRKAEEVEHFARSVRENKNSAAAPPAAAVN